MPGTGNASDARLVNYLLSHTTNETWILAVPSSQTGANLIIETGKPVMSIGGFSGSDRILSITSLETLIQEGKVRYFLTSGSGGCGRGDERGEQRDLQLGERPLHGSGPVFRERNRDERSRHCRSREPAIGSLYDCAGAAGSG